MFPNQESSLTESPSVTTHIGEGAMPSYDFNYGDFNIQNGSIPKLTDIKALEMWIEKVLITPKNRFKVYTTEDMAEYQYGISLDSYIGAQLPQPVINSLIQKDICDALANNKNIKSCNNFSFEMVGSKLKIEFTVNSVYGKINKEVNINA